MRTKNVAFMQYLKQRWESSEACRGPLEGCSDAEIAELKKLQNVDRLPELYVAFMSAMGRNMGGLEWHFGSELRYPQVLTAKEETFSELKTSNVFVLTHDWDGDCALYFRTDEDDPVLHWVGYGDSNEAGELDLVDRVCCTLSAWLVDMIESILEEHEVIKRRQAQEKSR